ncbi:MAG: type III-B CRISPR module-associated Cmr3 family protein [Candidatus Xenobia bacterium]
MAAARSSRARSSQADTTAPVFWRWSALSQWLKSDGKDLQLPIRDLGIAGLPRDVRTQVSLDEGSCTASEGALYQTESLRFSLSHYLLTDTDRLALCVLVDDAPPAFDGLTCLGGERRLVHWRSVANVPPDIPSEVVSEVVKNRAARILLVTPGAFYAGWRPKGLLVDGVTLEAAAVGRPVTASGWDLKLQSPKASRRLAPAGSVYFVRFAAELEELSITNWIKDLWLRPASDAEQDCKDGYGLALIGSWSGDTPEL